MREMVMAMEKWTISLRMMSRMLRQIMHRLRNNWPTREARYVIKYLGWSYGVCGK